MTQACLKENVDFQFKPKPSLLDGIRIFPVQLAEIETVSSSASKIKESLYFRIKLKLFQFKRNRIHNSSNFTSKKAINLARSQIKLENEIYGIAIRYFNSVMEGK